MHAVYELSTVKPHLPKRRRYTLAELAIYSDGYYQALAMALQVMTLAFHRSESRRMRDQKLASINSTPATPDRDRAGARTEAFVTAGLWYFTGVVVIVAAIEFLVLLGALIVRVLR